MTNRRSDLALFGGDKSVRRDPGSMFAWCEVTPAMEQAVLQVLRSGSMSGLDVTRRFEQEFARWINRRYALAHNNGTAAIHCALFGLGVGRGDEIICPSMTYWASCLPVYSLGGTVVFADIDPQTLCLDPADIERRISARTRAIVVVHYSGMPANMDAILAIARRRGVPVLEDASHAHGSLHRGRLTGTFGEAAAFSLMSGKSFPVGEGGMLVTDDRRIYERAVAFGHYERHGDSLTLPETREGAGLPWGGTKYRIDQFASAIGLEQLALYPGRIAEIDRAMNFFWDRLAGVPGIRAHRPGRSSGSTMGGWYNPLGHYVAEELGGLSVTRFCEAVRAEGVEGCSPGCNLALHTHPVFTTLDIYRDGRPTRATGRPENRTFDVPAEPRMASGVCAAGRPAGDDLRQGAESLPVSLGIQERVFHVPWFKRFDREAIEEHVAAFRKVAERHAELLPGDPGNPAQIGAWGMSALKRR
jgi:dTDP-4-amino-4,6-dideoxygalactose transaminase